MIIPLPELEFSAMSVSDYGRVFRWESRLFRGIPSEHVLRVQRMFDCGLISTLVERGLLVKSWISPMSVEGFGLVVEHEIIHFPTYPKEWTFSMLQDAALAVLEVNRLALQFGYQTADCHGYNVLFVDSRPVYVDLGSFKEVQKMDGVLCAYHEFMRSYYYPLKIWSTGGVYWGSLTVPRIGSLVPSEAYLKYRWPIFRLVKDSTLAKLVLALHVIRTIQHRDTSKLTGRCPRRLIPVLMWLRNHNFLSGPAKIHRLKRLVSSITPLARDTTWSGYHDGLTQEGGVNSTPRFDYIAEKISALGVDSVMEIAGNQGVLSRILAERATLKAIICTDGDGNALDKGYCSARGKQTKIVWAVLNPFAYESARSEIAVEQRFQAEAALALALTHHLLLTQNFQIDFIFDVIAKFATKYVLVEFMPLGLHNGTSAPPLPERYNEKWFEDHFIKRFEFIEKKQLEENRVLFIGKIRQAPNGNHRTNAS